MNPALAVTACSNSGTDHICLDVSNTNPEAGDVVRLTGWAEIPCFQGSSSYCYDPYTTVRFYNSQNYLLASGGVHSPSWKFSSSITAGPRAGDFTALNVGSNTVVNRSSLQGSSPDITITVRPKTSATSISASATTVKVGETITLSGNTSGYRLNGEASIKTGGNGNYTSIYAKAADPNLPTMSTSTVVGFGLAGTYKYLAAFTPTDNTNTASSSQLLVVTVLPADTIATLTLATPQPVVVGKPVTLEAGLNQQNRTTGTVSFYDGNLFLGSNNLYEGKAALTTGNLTSAGLHQFRFQYSGDPNYNASVSNVVDLQVEKTPSTVTLTSSASSIAIRKMLTLSAQIGGQTPGGTVSFVSDGVAITGCNAQPVTDGKAVCNSNKLKAGKHQITAIYSGDANNLGGQSAAMTQQITNLAWLPVLLQSITD